MTLPVTSDRPTESVLDSDSAPIAEFKYPRTVRFVDTDMTGHAHFSAYVRMMEETEYAFLRSRGLNVKLTDERGVMGFPRLQVKLQIHQPLAFDQAVTVQLKLVELDGKFIKYQFDIRDPDDQLRAQGQFKVALCRFPKDQPPYAILTPDYVIEALTNVG